jgi:acyl-CoA synthetase (AMP-forming)/AMP-acid ligase II
MQECLPPLSILWPDEHRLQADPVARKESLSSAGRPFEGIDIEIETENGLVASRDNPGEIVILSPTVTAGYWKNPSLTAEHLREGRWYSRDIGYFDQAGRIHILDRKQDLMVRHRRTIYPRRIEEEASCHPMVKEVCVVQLDAEEPVTAAVSLRARFRGSVDERWFRDDLLQFLRERLEDDGHVPEQVVVFDELPRNPAGKVLKREVRQGVAERSASGELAHG